MNPANAEPTRRERFEAAILVHLDAAYQLARWLLRDEHHAQDAVQDASLRAFRFFDTLQGPTPKAWFMTIVRNVCFDALAHDRRAGAQESFDEVEHDERLAEAAGRPATPEALALRAADVRRLHECLAALSNAYREVLVLREINDMSYREISEVVGVPIGTVMSRLARARDQLARLMTEAERMPGTR